MLLFPFAYGTEEGYYGPLQESLIEFTGDVAKVLGKTPLAKGYIGVGLAFVVAATEGALYLDEQAEMTHAKENTTFSYDGGAVYHLYC
jgi:hypothetical protein